MSWLASACEHLDDVHAAAAAWARCRQYAWLVGSRCFVGIGLRRWRRDGQQLSGPGDVLGAVAVGEQAVMPDAMEALR